MAHWLLKTEPGVFSFADLQKDGKAVWDGITNAVALKNLSQVRKGDELLIYHTGDETSIVGIAEAISNPFPDPVAGNPKLLVISVGPKRLLDRPVTLAEIKKDHRFMRFDLVRMPRLSVVPVSDDVWNAVLGLSTTIA